ncbi:hypothetical protein yc1106_07424 [Curvularia clavata]|uniref:Rhodopsin domain-containing protein n=1 Tax=Curvularia clavata TaxID=95742 RepID=A0A9Q8ZEA6_CURCL|nr:hypothetical protein yc1106_07424 [Curvularia clavata]
MDLTPTSRHMVRAEDYRFARITPDDHSATLWIVTLLAPIYATLVLGVRLGYTKWRAFGSDDIVVILAYVAGLGMWGVLLWSVGHGLGKSYDILDDAEISQVQRTFFASRILLYIALTLSKCSILVLVSEVFGRMPRVTYAAYVTIAFLVVWGLVGMISVPVGCSIEGIIPRFGSGHCIDSAPWIQALTAGDIFSEVAIILLPVLGLYGNKMDMEDKFIVMVAFSTRVPNIVFSIMYMLAYSDFAQNGQSAIQIVSTVAWQDTLLSYSLISATTPILKGFTQGFKTTGLSLAYARDPTTGEVSGAQTSFELRSLTKWKSRTKAAPQDTTPQAHTTSIQGRSKRKSKMTTLASKAKDGVQCYQDESASIVSQESRQVMIRQEWEASDTYR